MRGARGPSMSLGPAGDKGEQARRVFDALRAFDHTAVSAIWAQCPDSGGDRAGGHQPPEQSGGLPHRGGLTEERSEGSETVPLFPLDGADSLALGGCYVYSVAIPVVGTLLFTLLPWVMVLAWAWLGMDCGRQRRPFWLSLLAGHWGVLLSVLCGAWQFWLVDDAARTSPSPSSASLSPAWCPGR